MTSRTELMAAIDGEIEELIAEHLRMRPTWYAHDLVRWEEGRNFVEEPWDESQCTVSPEVREAMLLNLLTEDNLPYYHYAIATQFGEDSAIGRWTRRWTAEEGQHSIAIRDYLLTSRNVDPVELENLRIETVSRGWDSPWTDPIDIFVYTSAQELATRVSHRNTGRVADEETAYEVMKRVAADENYHYIFYKGVVSALLEHDPSACVLSMHKVYSNFNMPGTVIPNFRRRAAHVARAGVYDLRIHAEKVLQPVLREWRGHTLQNLSPDADEGPPAQHVLHPRPHQRARDHQARAA